MRILIIRNYPNYMDLQFNTYNIQEIGLAKALIRKGHVCDIVFWADKIEKTVDYIFDGDKHITVFYRCGKNILKNAFYDNLDSLIADYDIIQPSEYNQYQSWLLAKKYPKKTVIYHGPYYANFNTRYNLMCKIFDLFFLKRYVDQGTKFIVKSNLAQKFLVSKGIKEENVRTVGVGVDLGSLTVSEDSETPQFISDIDRFDDDLKLLYIGRLEERRNIPFLFDVIKCIAESHPKVRLIMIGNGDKDYVEKCMAYADAIGVNEYIFTTEKMEQKYLSYVYKKADYFLLPSKYEIFGMVLLEAMYFGTLVLTTKNGGSDVLIRDGINGIILDDDNPEEWAKRVISVTNNPEQYLAIKENAQKTIKLHFTWNALVDEFVNAYNYVRN